MGVYPKDWRARAALQAAGPLDYGKAVQVVREAEELSEHDAQRALRRMEKAGTVRVRSGGGDALLVETVPASDWQKAVG